jgi:predicted transcriptional regulator
VEIKAQAERRDDGWVVQVPELDNLTMTVSRLDKATEKIKELTSELRNEALCEIVVKIDAVMPGIICDIESAQHKMREAARLQEEASNEIRDVVARMRERDLTMRDIAVLLGVSPQRVAQLCPQT